MMNYTDLAASCLLGPNMHELYASLPVQRTLASTEVQSLLRLTKQLASLGDYEEISKLLGSLLDTTFPFEQVDMDIYLCLITRGWSPLVQKIVIHIATEGIKPSKKLVKEVIKSHFDKGDANIYDIALALKRWPMEDIWLYSVEEMLTLGKLQECGKILTLNGLNNEGAELVSCWERFLNGCAEKSTPESAITAILNLHKKLKPEDTDRFNKLVNYFLETTTENDPLFYPNVKSCFELASKTGAIFLESTLEKALLQLSRQGQAPERTFVNSVLQCKGSITTRSLNHIMGKLIEMNKENTTLSLFSLAVNGAFPKVNNEEVELSPALMKSLLVKQQKRIIDIQKEIKEKKKDEEFVEVEIPDEWEDYVVI